MKSVVLFFVAAALMRASSSADPVDLLKKMALPTDLAECEPAPGQTQRVTGNLDLPNGNYFITTFTCTSDKEMSGVVVWKDNGTDAKLAFHWLRQGPVPHTLAWIDFDKDQKDDLFLLSGKGNEAWTEVLANRGKQLKSIYFSDKEYGVLVDVDRDESPDVFESPEKISDENWCAGMEFPPTLAAQIKDKYQSISAKFKEANFNYDNADHHPVTNMYMLLPTRIYRYTKREQKMTDETQRFANHIAWRVNLLEKLLKSKDKIKWTSTDEDHEACYKQIQTVLNYWNSQEEKKTRRLTGSHRK